MRWGAGRKAGRRALRGGGWNNKPRNVRSANRNNNTPDNRNNNSGFRLAQSARTPELPRLRSRQA
ncbi:MAG: SUMF1/EgtB/PvdO family nonheme iron enzyme [Chromatiales bacterium]|nr:SUMF1/EgtB/PvdO family nonheme iron enzyme [Chromatiales bacterium]